METFPKLTEFWKKFDNQPFIYGYYNMMYKLGTICCNRLVQTFVLGLYTLLYKAGTVCYNSLVHFVMKS